MNYLLLPVALGLLILGRPILSQGGNTVHYAENEFADFYDLNTDQLDYTDDLYIYPGTYVFVFVEIRNKTNCFKLVYFLRFVKLFPPDFSRGGRQQFFLRWVEEVHVVGKTCPEEGGKVSGGTSLHLYFSIVRGGGQMHPEGGESLGQRLSWGGGVNKIAAPSMRKIYRTALAYFCYFFRRRSFLHSGHL